MSSCAIPLPIDYKNKAGSLDMGSSISLGHYGARKTNESAKD